jgi:hypothetical protein
VYLGIPPALPCRTLIQVLLEEVAKFRIKRSYLHKFKENNESRQKLLQTPAELKMAGDIAAHSGASGRNDQQVINPQSHENLHIKFVSYSIIFF